MSSTVEGALVSAVVFLVIALGYFIVVSGTKTPVREVPTAQPSPTTATPGQPEVSKVPLPPVDHETVPLTVEVL